MGFLSFCLFFDFMIVLFYTKIHRQVKLVTVIYLMIYWTQSIITNFVCIVCNTFLFWIDCFSNSLKNEKKNFCTRWFQCECRTCSFVRNHGWPSRLDSQSPRTNHYSIFGINNDTRDWSAEIINSFHLRWYNLWRWLRFSLHFHKRCIMPLNCCTK